MGPLSYPILRIGGYGKEVGPMNSTDDPYFSTLVGPRTHCFQFVKISLLWVGDVEICQELMTFMILFGFLPHSLVSVLIDS